MQDHTSRNADFSKELPPVYGHMLFVVHPPYPSAHKGFCYYINHYTANTIVKTMAAEGQSAVDQLKHHNDTINLTSICCSDGSPWTVQIKPELLRPIVFNGN